MVLRLRGGMQIRVDTMCGNKIFLTVEASDTIDVVKEKIQDFQNIPANHFRLWIAGKQLEESRTLLDYNIQSNDKLHMHDTELSREMLAEHAAFLAALAEEEALAIEETDEEEEAMTVKVEDEDEEEEVLWSGGGCGERWRSDTLMPRPLAAASQTLQHRLRRYSSA